MPLTDGELWACAQHVMNGFGDKAHDHVVARILDLALKADEEGVSTWQAIGKRIEVLMADRPANDATH